MEMHFNSFTKEKKLIKPITCCICKRQINNYMDSHNPEPLNVSGRICNVCNEEAVALRLKKMRENGM